MQKLFLNYVNDESGATAIEYGLIAALIGVAIMAAAGTVGEAVSGKFEEVADELNKTAAPTT